MLPALSIIVALAFAGGPVVADDANELEATVAQLIAELGDDSYETRSAAEARLRELGDAARPFLKKHATGDPEIAARIERVLDAIELATLAQLEIEEAHRLRVLGGEVHSVAVSADGSLLATGGERGEIIIRDVATGSPLRTLEGHRHWVGGLAFDPTGKRLVSAASDVILWNVTSGEIIERAAAGTTSVAWSRDGRWIAFPSGNGGVQVVDAKTLREHALLPNERGAMDALAFSADGRRVSFGNRYGDVFTYDIETGERTGLRKISDGRDVQALHFLADGDLAVGYSKGEIRIGGDGVRFPGTPSSFALSPDGKELAVCGQGSRALVWRLDDLAAEPVVHDTGGSWTMGVAFLPDGRLVTVGDDLRIWKDGRCTIYGGHASTPDTLAFSDDGKFLAAAGRHTVLLELSGGAVNHVASSGAVCSARDGGRFLQVTQNSVDVWDPVRLERVATQSFEKLDLKVIGAELAPRGDHVLLTTFIGFRWLPRDGGAVKTFDGIYSRVLDHFWDPASGRLALATVLGSHGEFGRLFVVDREGKVILRHEEDEAIVTAAIHPDGDVYWSDGVALHRYDVSNRKDTIVSSSGAAKVRFLGRRVLVAFEHGRISLRRVPDMRQLKSIRSTNAYSAAASPDGRHLAVGDADSVTVYRVLRR